MWLTPFLRQPDVLVMATFVLVVAGCAAAAPHIGGALLRLPRSAERDASAFEGYKIVFSTFGVMLAFLLAQAAMAHREVQSNIVKEAAALSEADRALLRLGTPDFAAVRPGLASYGALIVDDEWRAQSIGGRSAAATAAFAGVSDRVRALGPDDTRRQALYNALLRSLDELEGLREARLAASAGALPTSLWTAVIGLMIIAFAVAAFADRSFNRSVSLAAIAAAIGLLLSLVVIVDLPFIGEHSVSVAPIQRALEVNAARK
ncbi:uncharacterized protein DUF4239 [Roseiarcus fermentans]|uniref:Uncharacterized protein DUF4239 n=1 Tax=Roseiarcus fermentans TaxID=1473586 RepID=A0A366ES95_9HYPH|nr:DUF4239 domain-containing protein [Roseiarcus fermentans]RBP04560.1 uncharacterized protein DUF4239 [Roseiarcus fermentans]